ncbi:MAG TPA: tetratricopeptide repeat protein [Chloroflexota bacterium]|nr:tetratricopeptide repeat protein [Chloroflexota bacterium]
MRPADLEMRPLQAHCHLGLGKLYRRIGRPDEARAELATAVAMLREMGMAFWLPEAEGELAGPDRKVAAGAGAAGRVQACRPNATTAPCARATGHRGSRTWS